MHSALLSAGVLDRSDVHSIEIRSAFGHLERALEVDEGHSTTVEVLKDMNIVTQLMEPRNVVDMLNPSSVVPGWIVVVLPAIVEEMLLETLGFYLDMMIGRIGQVVGPRKDCSAVVTALDCFSV